MFLVFEGPDASGKTTLARGVAERLNGSYLSSIPAEMAAMRSEADQLPVEDRLRFYQFCNGLTGSRVKKLVQESSDAVVLDRWVFSTVAYNESFVSRSLRGYLIEALHEPAYARPDAVVYVTADADVRSERATKDGTRNLWFDVSLQAELVARYETALASVICPVITIDTTEFSADQALAKCEAELLSAGIWPSRAED